MRRLFALSALLLFGFVNSLFAKQVTLRGYVTAMDSPVRFAMDNYRITDDTDAEHRRLDIHSRNDSRSPQLEPGTLRVGLEVEVKGEYDSKTGEVRATGIKALHDDCAPGTVTEGMGLVDAKTSLQKTGQSWLGRLAADGETIVITPDTVISVKRTRNERKQLQAAGQDADSSAFSPEDINLDAFASYTGVRQADHTIVAKTIVFRQDRGAVESDWSSVQPKVVYEDPKSETGKLTNGEREYDLFPSPEAADYLNKLGASLIPAHQRELPDKSPGKMVFRFFLANTDSVAVDSYPNGVIVVSVRMFDVLENEAELAFVLSHEIARVVEKQEWTAATYHEKERKGIAGAGMASSLVGPGSLVSLLVDKRIAHQFARALHDQADRIGIQYMIASGYDPSQSVEAWRVLEEKQAKGHFWGDRDTNFTRRTYLESELQLDHANQDFSALKHNSSDFQRVVYQIETTRKRAKVKTMRSGPGRSAE
jgi:hypothetical protein